MARSTSMNNSKVNKKLKKFGYLILTLIGIIMIFIAATFFHVGVSEDKQGVSYGEGSALYDILIGIGCGLVATGVGTMLITILLSDITEKKENLDEWGIEGIYADRFPLKEEDLPRETLKNSTFNSTNHPCG